jgi:hypothetical protein
MTVRILRTPDGKKVAVDPKTDECLYKAPRDFDALGTDLYCHVSRKGNRYFYKYAWSLLQGDDCFYILVSEDKAKEFLLDKAGLLAPIGLTQEEMQRAEEIFPNIFEEDA